MMNKIARLSLITFLFLGLVLTTGLFTPPTAHAQFENVQMGVSGMI